MPHPIHGQERTSDENDSQQEQNFPQGSNERHEEEQQQRPQHDSSARQSHQRLHRDDTNGSDISGGAISQSSSSYTPWGATSVASRAAAAAAAALSTSTTEFSAADDPRALRQSASAASASASATARIQQQQQQQQQQQSSQSQSLPQQQQTIDSKPSVDSTDSSRLNKGGPLWKLAGIQARQVQPQAQHPSRQPQQQPVVEEQHYASPSPSSPPSAPAPHNRQDLLSDDGDQNVETMDDEFQQATQRQKQRGQQHQRKRGNGPGARLAETLMERMRSRADPNAPIGLRNGTNTDYTPPRRAGTEANGDGDRKDSSATAGAGALYSPLEQQQQQDKMVRIGDAEDEGFIIRDAGYAQKRVRVVQLLIVGLVGLLLGWLGNFFVGTSCHFAAINVQVGQNGDDFKLHFGLWKYSPADSALSGYTYCYPYSGSHDEESPIFARVANLLALLAGTYSLGVLWVYLITGRALRSCWRWAVWMGYLAGVLQFLTLGFFVSHLCQIRSCQWGPAASLALATAVAWVALGWELHYQAPPLVHASGSSVASRESRHGGRRHGESYDDDDYRDNEDKDVVHEAETVVTTLEMADFHGASQEYMDRAFGKHSSSPSTSASQQQRPPSSASTIATNTTTMSHHHPSTTTNLSHNSY